VRDLTEWFQQVEQTNCGMQIAAIEVNTPLSIFRPLFEDAADFCPGQEPSARE
jgi:hypothetical protein